jgi:uncharacterized membrane protein YbhN (UPF0104 family)
MKLLFAIIGLGLLASVLASIDLGQVLDLLGRVGWGFLLVMLAAFLAFTADAASWLAVLPGLPFDLRNLAALSKVRLVGEMLNLVTPAAGVGGEPAKALILIIVSGSSRAKRSHRCSSQRRRSCFRTFRFSRSASC